ncbi:hypothetical protein HBH43_189040 [Parastagonospora nodorum]|nr:hypothetical protein HBH43_189040 [Parastagonospora nodorum]
MTPIGEREWPIPPVKQVHDSRITLIKPYTQPALSLLLTCRFIKQEAHPILKRKVQHYKSQPLRYLVDYSAAHALIHKRSPLRRCLGLLAINGRPRRLSNHLRSFIDLCAVSLSQVRHTQNAIDGRTGYFSRGKRAIELTITHKDGVVYGAEVMETIYLLSAFTYIGPARCVIIYKSPLPEIDAETMSRTPFSDAAGLEAGMQRAIPRELDGEQAKFAKGVFIRPLGEEDFQKHLDGLDLY